MATVGTNVTWKDVAAGVDPSGKTLEIVEMMDEVNEIMNDMVMVEGNTQTGHMVSIRDGIPAGTFRRINRGTPEEKATEHAVEFASGIIEGRGAIDELLVKLQKEPERFRIRQNRGHIHGMSQTIADTIFYGDVETYPDRWTGLSAFYSDLSADSGENIIDAGGSEADLTSLWLVIWSDDIMCGFYPQNTMAGIEHEDKGKEKCFDDSDNVLYKFVDVFRAYMGIVVADWRQAVRIANIDLSDLKTAGDDTDVSANLLKMAIQAKNLIWNPSLGRGAWYARREIKTALDIKARNKPNLQINMQTIKSGEQITMLEGFPVRRVDALLATESQVT